MSFRDILISVANKLYEIKPEDFRKIALEAAINEVRTTDDGLRMYKVTDGIFIETNKSSKDIIGIIKKLLLSLNIPFGSFWFSVKR